jgi:hypothetical protein
MLALGSGIGLAIAGIRGTRDRESERCGCGGWEPVPIRPLQGSDVLVDLFQFRAKLRNDSRHIHRVSLSSPVYFLWSIRRISNSIFVFAVREIFVERYGCGAVGKGDGGPVALADLTHSGKKTTSL